MKLQIPLIGSGQQSQALSLGPHKLVNLYEVISGEREGNKYPSILVGTPGTELYTTLPNQGTIRGMLEFNDMLYVVCDNKLYGVGTTTNALELGTLSTSSGRVSIINSGTQLMIVDGSFGYTYTFSSGTFATITDADFSPSDYVTYQAARAIYVQPGTDKFYVSDLNDFSSYTATNFASAESDPQNLVVAFGTQVDLYLFGRWNTEIWALTGDADFPYERRTGVSVPYGCAAKRSVVDVNGTVVWLSRNDKGNGLLLSIEDYKPKRLLDKSSVNRFSKLTRLDDAYAFSFEYQDHVFYAITFPTDNVSFLYDFESNKLIQWGSWYQEGTFADGSGKYIFGRHLADSFAFFDNKLIVSDYRGGGRLLRLRNDVYTDYDCGPDNSIYRELITPILAANKQRMNLDELVIDCETGVSSVMEQSASGNLPLLNVNLSKDGGRTFAYNRQVNYGFTGEYKTHVQLSRFGQFRDGALKISTNHPSFVAIFGLIADIEIEGPPMPSRNGN